MLKKMTPQNEDSSTQWVEDRKPSSTKATMWTMMTKGVTFRSPLYPLKKEDEVF
jgi:hypothetical protein